MTSPDDGVWKRRFAAFAAFRVSGLLIAAAGVAVAFSDWIRRGGWQIPGIMIAVLGLILATVPPALMKRGWRGDRP